MGRNVDLVEERRPDPSIGVLAMVPAGRIGEPADVARAVVFLCGDDAGYLTGVNLPVNGGLFISF